MKTIILLSHGELAKGMADTAQMIMGKQKNLYAISAYTEEDVYKRQVQGLTAGAVKG